MPRGTGVGSGSKYWTGADILLFQLPRPSFVSVGDASCAARKISFVWNRTQLRVTARVANLRVVAWE